MGSWNLVTVAPAGLTPLSQLHGVTGKLVLCCWVGISQGPETDLKEGERVADIEGYQMVKRLSCSDL